MDKKWNVVYTVAELTAEELRLRAQEVLDSLNGVRQETKRRVATFTKQMPSAAQLETLAANLASLAAEQARRTGDTFMAYVAGALGGGSPGKAAQPNDDATRS